MEVNRVLVVAAHPDDEILGCGGTVARLIEEGAVAYSLILGEGKTSRQKADEIANFEDAKINLKSEARRANSIIGIKEVFFSDFPDNKFDVVPLIDIVKSIESVKENIRPNIIFTHHMSDLNIDHKLTCQAVLTATRPMAHETVDEIFSFEVLSSTEWNYPTTYSPNTFINITHTVQKKMEAMEAYGSELREYPHPRSLRALEQNAKTWAFKCGIDGFVESFYLNRKIVR